MIVNIMPQLGTSLTDDFRVIIYNRNVFIKQATGVTQELTHKDYHNLQSNIRVGLKRQPVTRILL